MFVFRKEIDKPVTWPVIVEVAQDGGKIKKHEFQGKFLRLNDDQRKAINDELGSLSDKEGDQFIDAWVERTTRIMVGWAEVVDEKNTPVEYSQQALRDIAAGPVGVAFMSGVGRAIAQIESGIKAKN